MADRNKGGLSLHRGHPVNVPIRRTAHLFTVIPANNTKESVFRHLEIFIPIVTYCAPPLADLLLFCYEKDVMLSLSDNTQQT